MLSTLTTGLTLLALTGASPVPQAPQQISRAKAYTLQIQLYDPSKPDLDPPVAGKYLGTVHTGAGLNIAVATDYANTDPNYKFPPYYTNGTDGYSSVQNDLGTQYPWGVQVQSPTETDYTYPKEHDVTVNVGGGTNGVGIQAWGDDLFLGGVGAGAYAVCNRFIGYTRSNLTAVRFVYDGEEVPEGCVLIRFVPLCAELNDLPEGSQWTHDFVQEVNCVVPGASKKLF
ncbi:hypothetical protein F4821DRAFT_247743 [Hypoxylon rubiginosum]|uniref:Uncharacterized protein n=1 Tax=Hypoxylon rubiginosum TaxID=110542 RepID=A0ACC0CP07_9PEZI|nr:hypothetical protein F4821DRAFT_247743 [Hypoxylon rubiginosum]